MVSVPNLSDIIRAYDTVDIKVPLLVSNGTVQSSTVEQVFFGNERIQDVRQQTFSILLGHTTLLILKFSSEFLFAATLSSVALLFEQDSSCDA